MQTWGPLLIFGLRNKFGTALGSPDGALDEYNDGILEGKKSESHGVHLVELYLALMKASYSALLMVKYLVL